LRVLVVGDSVGITLGRGLALWSNATGRAVVDDAARKWCSLGRDLPRIAGIGTSEQGQGCDSWATRWARLRDRFDPDVVVVLFTIWEVVPRQLPGQDFTGLRDAAHARWQFGEYQAAADVLGAGGAKVVWLTIPCASNAKSAPGSDIAMANDNLIDELPNTRPFVRVLDLDAQVCPEHTFVSSYDGVNDARPDGLHFSDAGARAVANWMMPIIMGDVPPPAPISTRRAHLQ
jgi:hypothetical protein